jgi:hypothetical protein
VAARRCSHLKASTSITRVSVSPGESCVQQRGPMLWHAKGEGRSSEQHSLRYLRVGGDWARRINVKNRVLKRARNDATKGVALHAAAFVAQRPDCKAQNGKQTGSSSLVAMASPQPPPKKRPHALMMQGWFLSRSTIAAASARYIGFGNVLVSMTWPYAAPTLPAAETERCATGAVPPPRRSLPMTWRSRLRFSLQTSMPTRSMWSRSSELTGLCAVRLHKRKGGGGGGGGGRWACRQRKRYAALASRIH